MMSFRKPESFEIKIFVLFVLVTMLFSSFIGNNDETRVFLARSIADNASININQFYNATVDRAFFNGSYFSDKPPGSSFFAVPVYIISKSLFGTPQIYHNLTTPISDHASFALYFLIILVLSSIPGGITVVLFYRLSAFFSKSDSSRKIATFCLAFSTMILGYSSIFMGNSLSLMLVFLSFYLSYTSYRKNKVSFSAGFFSGLAILVDYWVAPVVLLSLYYSFKSSKKSGITFFLAMLPPLIVLSAYTYMAFGSFFTVTYSHIDATYWSVPNSYLSTPSINLGGNVSGIFSPVLFDTFVRMLFYSYRGLMFYNPLIILVFLFFFEFFRKYKSEAASFLILFVLYLCMSSVVDWWGGGAFKLRFMLPTMPFIFIALIFAIERLPKKFFIPIALFSIFINFLGFEIKEDIASQSILPAHKFLVPLSNPLSNHYLNLFLSSGLNSSLFEGFIGIRFPDFFNIIILTALFSAFFWKEIINLPKKFRSFKNNKKPWIPQKLIFKKRYAALLIVLTVFYIAFLAMHYYLGFITPFGVVEFFVPLIFIFFIPGFLFYLLFFSEHNFFKALPFISGSSVLFFVILTGFLNIFLGMHFSYIFTSVLVLLSVLPQAFVILNRKEDNYNVDISIDRSIALILAAAFLLYLTALILMGYSIMGADVGRFAIISHAMFLKGTLTPNLEPYDLINGFFYFPGAFVLPLVFEFFGFDPIVGVSVSALIFEVLSVLPIFFIFKKFISKKKSVAATFFYALMFSPIFIFLTFGVFPYAFSLFYFLLAVLVILEFFISKKLEPFLFLISVSGMLAFHYYPVIVAGIFGISCLIYFWNSYFVKKGLPKIFALALVSVILFFPYIMVFGKYIPYSFTSRNSADLVSMASNRYYFSFPDKLNALFMNFPIPPGSSYFFVAGLVLLVMIFREKFRFKALLFSFIVLLLIFSFAAVSENNFSRMTVFIWIFYSFAFGFFVDDKRALLVLLLIFPIIISPSVLFWVGKLNLSNRQMTPWILWPGFFKAIDFIKTSTPLNSTFMIDGGGAGCTGASGNYGERIFPLTSRKIFYFTNDCWAHYNVSDYEGMVALYNSISINPNNQTAISMLKKYGVSYIYVGPYSVGLSRILLEESSNYSEVFNFDETSIFRIN